MRWQQLITARVVDLSQRNELTEHSSDCIVPLTESDKGPSPDRRDERGDLTTDYH